MLNVGHEGRSGEVVQWKEKEQALEKYRGGEMYLSIFLYNIIIIILLYRPHLTRKASLS